MPRHIVPQLVYFPGAFIEGTHVATPFWGSSPGAIEQLLVSAREGRFGSIPLENLFMRTKDHLDQPVYYPLCGSSGGISALQRIDGYFSLSVLAAAGFIDYDP